MLSDNHKESEWDSVYGNEFGSFWYPAEELIKFSARYLKRRTGLDNWQEKRKVNRILEAGCGNGRHVLFFQEQGYETYGVDISKEAIDLGNEWLKRKGLKPTLQVGNITNLPFDENYFDVIVSFGVLDHIPFLDAKKAIKEIVRVCNTGGYVYLSLRSTESSEFGRGKKTDNNTFVLDEGYEKGIIQHYFDLKEIEELMRDFRVFNVDLVEEISPAEYTLDKCFLQSSQGFKKYFDLTKPLDLSLKDSRWHVVAEKI